MARSLPPFRPWLLSRGVIIAGRNTGRACAALGFVWMRRRRRAQWLVVKQLFFECEAARPICLSPTARGAVMPAEVMSIAPCQTTASPVPPSHTTDVDQVQWGRLSCSAGRCLLGKLRIFHRKLRRAGMAVGVARTDQFRLRPVLIRSGRPVRVGRNRRLGWR